MRADRLVRIEFLKAEQKHRRSRVRVVPHAHSMRCLRHCEAVEAQLQSESYTRTICTSVLRLPYLVHVRDSSPESWGISLLSWVFSSAVVPLHFDRTPSLRLPTMCQTPGKRGHWESYLSEMPLLSSSKTRRLKLNIATQQAHNRRAPLLVARSAPRPIQSSKHLSLCLAMTNIHRWRLPSENHRMALPSQVIPNKQNEQRPQTRR